MSFKQKRSQILLKHPIVGQCMTLFQKAGKFILDFTTILQGPFCSVPSDLVTLIRDNPQTSTLLASDTLEHLIFPQAESPLKVQALIKSLGQSFVYPGRESFGKGTPSPSIHQPFLHFHRVEAGIGKKSDTSRAPDMWLKACKKSLCTRKLWVLSF